MLDHPAQRHRRGADRRLQALRVQSPGLPRERGALVVQEAERCSPPRRPPAAVRGGRARPRRSWPRESTVRVLRPVAPGGEDERMLTWAEFAAREPDLAASGRALLYQYGGVGLAFLGTVRPDGGPRVHPMCPILHGDGLYALLIPGPKRSDLHRDPRYALHCFPPEDERERVLHHGDRPARVDERCSARRRLGLPGRAILVEPAARIRRTGAVRVPPRPRAPHHDDRARRPRPAPPRVERDVAGRARSGTDANGPPPKRGAVVVARTFVTRRSATPTGQDTPVPPSPQ